MPSILVVEQEERYVERINGALSAEGWRVRVVPRADQAIQAAASEAPDLVMVSAEIPGAETLASSFSRSAGGPGVVGLLSEEGTGAIEADDLLAKPFTDDQLRSAARRALNARRPAPPIAASGAEHKLTSQDIFGDVLAEVEGGLAAPSASPAPKPPAADDEMQRRLEKTLSGILPGSEPKPRPPAAPPPRRPEPAADNVDAMLSRTLSNLDLGRTKTGAVRVPTPAPPAAAAAPPRPAPAAPPVAVAPPSAPPAVKPSTPPPAAAPPPTAAKEGTAVRRRVGDFDFSELEELARTSSRPAPPPARPAAPAAPAAAAPVAKAVPAPVRPAAAPPAPKPEPLKAAPPPPPAARVAEPFDAAVTQPIPLFADEAGDQPGERFGQYTLLERIAAGGMAEVWKARMRGVEGFQKTVAIKRILSHMTDNAEFIGMFIDEAKLAAQLTHPNIVHIYDLGKIGRDYYIAMEYVEGKDLRSLLNVGRRKGMPLPLELGLMIAARLASALDYAHRKRDFEDREMGLVHRDVSPQNVLLTYDGDVKLCDFGIAKAVSKAGQTQIGALKGKLQYMSPEQAWGRPVDARSDLFSLGAVLFEMATGERLFAGDSEISVLESVRQGKTRSPRQVNPSIPREVDEIVTRALVVDPGDRFQTADEMKRRLGAAISALAPSVGPTDLAAYIQRVLEPEPAERPADEAPPAPVPIPAAKTAAPVAAAPVVPFPSEPEPPVEAVAPLVEVKVEDDGGRRSRTLLYAAIAALVAIAVVTFFLLSRRPAAVPPAGGAPAPAPAATLPAANPVPGQTAPQRAPAGPPAPAAGQMPPDIKAIVDKQLAEKDAELQRQKEAKLKELEQQVADAKKAADKPAVPAPAPLAAADKTPPQAAPPEPTPAPPQPETQRQTEPAQAQVPAAEPQREPEAPRVKVGDLATPGAGVVPPKLVSSPKPEYPPMARRLGVQGVVTVGVLVDENGQVQDVRMEGPIPQKVGINEAAMSAARAVRYQPATKEGVRVKMWTRLKIPFKM
jgi:TonB family protein